MSDGDALLAAVKATPDDDTPRLVYADWLDDCGEGDRAAFIRVQVELARVRPIDLGDVTLNYLPAPDAPAVVLLSLSRAGKLRPGQWARMHAAIPGGRWTFDGQLLSAAVANVSEGTAALTVVVTKHPDADWEAELVREGRALLHEHGGAWVGLEPPRGVCLGNAGVLTVPDGWHNQRYTFARGLVDECELTAEWWLAHADAILAAHPVRRVTLTTWPGETVGWPMLVRGVQGGDHFYGGWDGVAFELPPTVAEVPFRGSYEAWAAQPHVRADRERRAREARESSDAARRLREAVDRLPPPTAP